MADAFTCRAQQSWLADAIPHDKIPAVLTLVEEKEDVLKRYFAAATAYCNEQARFSVSTLDSNFSSAASIKSSIYPSVRTSLASEITNYSLNSTTSTEPARPTSSALHDPSTPDPGAQTARISRTILGKKKKPKDTPVDKKPKNLAATKHVCPHCKTEFSRAHDLKRHTKDTCSKYICPTCSACFSKSHDLKEHINTVCESLERHLCHGCQHKEKFEAAIAEHRVFCAKRLGHPVSHSKFDLPPKKAFGCPHCGTLHTKLDEYSKCVVADQQKTRRPPVLASLRLKALLRQDDVVDVVQTHCSKLGLKLDSCEWDDANASWFAERLEYGQNDADDPDQVHKLGYDDIDEFVEALLRKRIKSEPTPTPEPNMGSHQAAHWQSEASIRIDHMEENVENDMGETSLSASGSTLTVQNGSTSNLGMQAHPGMDGFAQSFPEQHFVGQGQFASNEYSNEYDSSGIYTPVDTGYPDNVMLPPNFWNTPSHTNTFASPAPDSHFMMTPYVANDYNLPEVSHMNTFHHHSIPGQAPDDVVAGTSLDVRNRTQVALEAQTSYHRPPLVSYGMSKSESKRPISYDSYNHPDASSRSTRAPAHTKLAVRTSPRSNRAIPMITHAARSCEPECLSTMSPPEHAAWLLSAGLPVPGQPPIPDEHSYFSDESEDEGGMF